MDHFIYVLSLQQKFRIKTNWTEKEDHIVSEHYQYLLDLKEKKVLIMAGKSRYDVDHDDTFGIVVFQSDTEENAHHIMQNDPAIIAGLMTAELHPFNIAVM